MRTQRKVLWLTGWYPNKLAPFEGDFIQRHAEAVSLFYDVTVIYIKKDGEGKVTEDLTRETSNRVDGLEERIYYYKPKHTGIKPVDKLISLQQYYKIIRQAITQYLADHTIPPFIHLHIASHAGLGALWLKNKYRVNFMISEHWSGYLPKARPGWRSLGPWQILFRKYLFKKARALTVVSNVLGEAVQAFSGRAEYTVIPNVVNTNIFNLNGRLSPTINNRFIHISTLGQEKNISTIIEAFFIVHAKYRNIQLLIYGPENPDLTELIHQKGLQDVVICKGEVSQPELAKELRSCKSLVTYSLYETFGCVVIEANACGVPAIVSDLPVFREYVHEGKTGVFVPLNNKLGLAQAVLEVMEGDYHFDKISIADEANAKFSYQEIGRQFHAVYQNVLG